MNAQDITFFSEAVVGWAAGILAVLTVLASRGRVDLWSRYFAYSCPAVAFSMASEHRWSWYALLTAFPLYALTCLVFWLDIRKKFPR